MEQSILVVESELPVRQPLAEYLRECGYKVFEAVNTDEAMIVLAEYEGKIDVVLCDVASQGRLDGFGLARWVRTNSTARIILAASVGAAAEQAAGLCEDGPLLEKPYHHQTLTEMIKRLLARHGRSTPTRS
jgi:DNA-binding response OmpR family regulator